MQDNEIARVLYRLVGQVEATNKSIDEKFDVVFAKIDDVKTTQKNHEGRINCIEIDWKWVTRLAGVVGGLTSLIVSSALFTISRLLW